MKFQISYYQEIRLTGWCNRSAGDAYSSMAPDPTSGVSRSPCSFIFTVDHSITWTIHWFWLGIYLTRWTDFDSGLFCLPNLDTLILITDFYVLYEAHSGCKRLVGDAYSSMTPDHTSEVFRGPCTPFLWFIFCMGFIRLITVRYFCHFI
jgi:hypothetical protein